MLPAEVSTRPGVPPPAELIGALIVISPACAPALPVVIVTLLNESIDARSVAENFALSRVASHIFGLAPLHRKSDVGPIPISTLYAALALPARKRSRTMKIRPDAALMADHRIWHGLVLHAGR
jgi:hypothetical protein